MSRSHIARALRERVVRAARHRCGYCLTSAAVVGTPMEIDHLIPEARGGESVEANLWLACSSCNTFKRDLVRAPDPLTGEEVALFNPRAQDWWAHSQWSAEGNLVLGLTPSGRATIVALRLNRAVLVAARRRWVRVGWHPPPD